MPLGLVLSRFHEVFPWWDVQRVPQGAFAPLGSMPASGTAAPPAWDTGRGHTRPQRVRAEGCRRGTGSPRGGAAAPALVLALIGKLEPGTLAQAAAYISQLLSLAAGASAPAWKHARGGPQPPVPGGASAPLRRPPRQSGMGCVAGDRFTLMWVFLDPYGSAWAPRVPAVLASLGVIPCAPRDAGADCRWVLLVPGQSEGQEGDFWGI